jgi:Ca2+-binding RTX toxin-like protein
VTGGTSSGADGNDTLSNIERVRGSSFADTLIGNSGENFLRGGAGNDTIDGGAGNDWADYRNASGAVQVTLTDALNGVTGGTSSGADGNDTLSNIERVRGSSFADTLIGNSGENFLRGGEGNDTIDGGAGFDWADYADASGAVQVTLTDALNGVTGGTSSGADGNDTLSNIEAVSGSAFADTLIGNSGNNFLQGGAGNDTIDGGAGFDWADYAGASGAVQVTLTDALNGVTGGTSSGADGNDTLSNIERVKGSSFADTLIGNSGENFLRGGAGNDTINGGDGSDTAVFSGNRADYTIAVNANGALTVADKVANRDGTDTLSQIEQLQFSDQTITVNAAWAALPFPDLFAANLSQAKAIASAYQTLLGGIPGISGFDFLIKGNLTSNFGASPSAVFNDENVFINVANALVQGNAEATTKFSTLAAGTTLSEKITSLYKSIIPDAKQSADGIAFLTRPDGLKFYQDVAKERGITAENGPAVIALASLLKVAVDGKIGIGNPVSDLIASIADGSSGLPAGSATVLPIETIDGTKFDADDASDALPGFSGLAPAPAPLIGIIADTGVMF